MIIAFTTNIAFVIAGGAIMAAQLIDVLKSSDSIIRQQAEAAIEALGSDAIEALAVAMRSDNPGQAWRAAKLLAKIDDPRRAVYMEQSLVSANGLVGQVAVKAIVSVLSPNRAGEILTEHLLDSPPMIQIHMVTALSTLRYREAIENFIVLLETTESAEVRYITIEGLGLLHATQATDLIRSFADDRNHHVQERVQTALRLLMT